MLTQLPKEMHQYIAHFLDDTNMLHLLATCKLLNLQDANFWLQRCKFLHINEATEEPRKLFFQFKRFHSFCIPQDLQVAANTLVERNKFNCKVIMMGFSNVGKSTLARRLVGRDFDDYPSNVGASFLAFEKTFEKLQIRFEMWDTAGQERYRSAMAPMYYRNAHIVLLCYSMNDASTLSKAFEYVTEAAQHYENKCILLVGCKQDLPCKVVDLHKWRNKHKNIVALQETSSKSKYGLEALILKMNKIAKHMHGLLMVQEKVIKQDAPVEETQPSTTSSYCIVN